MIQYSCCWHVKLAQPNVYSNCKFEICYQANIQNTSYTYKINKIHFNSQILNTNRMSASLSVSVHYSTISYFCVFIIQIFNKS